jgi:N-acetylglucosaminyldiphosphoundecaprenol N-acetyl-beta-D-mannosaminyltransferase
MRNRVNLLGTWVDCLDVPQALAQIDAFVRSRRPHQIITANVDFVRHAHRDVAFRTLVNGADLVLADGMPLVWASRRSGQPLPCRITGVDMLLACSQLAEDRGYRIFLLGAAPGVADEAAEVLRARFPGLCIVGTYAPRIEALTDRAETIQIIRDARPDLLFVAFGAPKQDKWIDLHLESLGVPVCMGVGGAFDMLSGRVRRAPIWMQQHGLEWLNRLMQEPTRLWKRYLIHDLPIFVRLMLQPRDRGAHLRPAKPVLLVEEVLPDLAPREEPSARVG